MFRSYVEENHFTDDKRFQKEIFVRKTREGAKAKEKKTDRS